MNSIHLICLGVQDLAQSRKFYRAIGFVEPNDEHANEIVFFNNTGTKLELFPYSELLKDIGLNATEHPFPKSFNGVTHAFNAKSKEEVDFIFKKALANGAQLIKQPVWGDWGGYSGYFSDPNGYYWEVAYSKDWQFDDNDMLVIE
ncbi:VOC family protein [Paucilactobacillus kaifaensis]|uniref:VOC family protein n=1 Tax=Paucilactobacillus kaifaensis TaxID=2559921 RepID=UPI0010F8248B|nr:VOC family protein [Paucilactobacillus kaifaensis]